MSNKLLLKKCLEDNIPIIRANTSKLILDLITNNNYTSLLEIGTAYGYSCSLWTQHPNLKSIVSLEKLSSNYEIAKSFLNNEKLTLINIDAFEYKPNQKFDLIFIDGPKSNQEVLVSKYVKYLNKNGVMVIDNLYLKKFSEIDQQLLTKNQLKLINKLTNFRNWLLNNPLNLKFTLCDIDDGVGILEFYAK